MPENKNNGIAVRPPVVVIMGHIDHGKSTLLDYIRKTNVADCEAGGITQCISAYEVVHKDTSGLDDADGKGVGKKITFLDTPGHEAFSRMRERGIKMADIAILIVSAEDGVKPQTIEAWKAAVASNTPVIVAINKVDKPGANVEKTKTELAENEVYLENYGGKVPCALISAKTGEGIDELLSLILILSELEDLKGDNSENASGFIVETNLDSKRGIIATLLIKNGTLRKGMTVATENSTCATKMFENFNGTAIDEATFSSPVRLVGFDKMPRVGSEFTSFQDKKDALSYAESRATSAGSGTKQNAGDENKKIIPIVLKADVAGMLEAIEKEIAKIQNEGAVFKIIQKGVGPISENDMKAVAGKAGSIVIGFNVKTDKSAAEIAMKQDITISFFDIIYEMTEWLTEEMEKRRPKIETTETTGQAKILKTFSRTKERQILGGKVVKGNITLGGIVKILRRDFEIGNGKIVNLEKSKAKTSAVEEGAEFGMMLESKIEVAPGDIIESFSVVHK